MIPFEDLVQDIAKEFDCPLGQFQLQVRVVDQDDSSKPCQADSILNRFKHTLGSISSEKLRPFRLKIANKEDLELARSWMFLAEKSSFSNPENACSINTGLNLARQTASQSWLNGENVEKSLGIAVVLSPQNCIVVASSLKRSVIHVWELGITTGNRYDYDLSGQSGDDDSVARFGSNLAEAILPDGSEKFPTASFRRSIDICQPISALYQSKKGSVTLPDDEESNGNDLTWNDQFKFDEIAHFRDSVIISGSFCPLHEGHLGMADWIEKKGLQAVFELPLMNADKPPLDVWEILDRCKQPFGKRKRILTLAPTFLEKSRIAPNNRFAIGIDTLIRIADKRFYSGNFEARANAYAEIKANGCGFLVFGRQMQSQFLTVTETAIPADLLELCQSVDENEFRVDVSSTMLRNNRTASTGS